MSSNKADQLVSGLINYIWEKKLLMLNKEKTIDCWSTLPLSHYLVTTHTSTLM